MALLHHDAREYNEAASAAADKARRHMEGMIERGRDRATSLIEHVRATVPTDYVVAPQAVAFDYDGRLEAQGGLRMAFGNHDFPLHRHARGQAVAKTGILTGRVADAMVEAGEWGQRMLVDNLNRIFEHQQRERVLVREAAGEVRAVLSDRFRRMDSDVIIGRFAEATTGLGAVPVESHATDTKWAIKVMLPKVFEPVDHEVMAFGLALTNSDFGDGALSVRGFCLRLWCTNYAISEESLRQVHLGKRFKEHDVAWSERTRKLDTDTMASAVSDIVVDLLGPERVNRECAIIKVAAEQEIDAPAAIERLRKGGALTKAEAKAVAGVYNRPDVEMLPAGNTAWRLSNALSLFAQEVGEEDVGRRLEVEAVAGQVLGGVKLPKGWGG